MLNDVPNSDILFELAQQGGIPLTHPKSSSRRASPTVKGQRSRSSTVSSIRTTPSTPGSRTPTRQHAIPPPAPLPPPSTLFSSSSQILHHPESMPISWVDPVSIPLPGDISMANGGHRDFISAHPSHLHSHGPQYHNGVLHSSSTFLPQQQQHHQFGMNAFGESLFGTWIQAPPQTDPRFQIQDGQGYVFVVLVT